MWGRTNESYAASSEESLGPEQQHRDQQEESDCRRKRDAADEKLAHVDDHAQRQAALETAPHFPRPAEDHDDEAVWRIYVPHGREYPRRKPDGEVDLDGQTE